MVFAMDINNKAETFEEIVDVDMPIENSTHYNNDIIMECTMPKLVSNNSVS